MSYQKHLQYTKNLTRCYEAVLQSSTKGIRAIDIAKKLGVHKTVVHRNLNTLEFMGKVESQHGVWRIKAGEQTIKPLEKEIEIELPIPKNQWLNLALLEALAKDAEREKFVETAKTYRIVLEKERESRTVRIKGKNVDDLDLEKLGNLIQQTNEKGSKFNLKGFLKNLKRPRIDSVARKPTKARAPEES